MDILLFNQYFTSKKDDIEVNLATLPLNLLHLATFLKAKNLDCKIYELGIFDRKDMLTVGDRVRFGISDEEIVKIIKKEKPKIIGLSCMYSRHYRDVIESAKLIKKTDSSIKIVIGGNHATSFSDMILKIPEFDFIVRGEGEITFYELCKAVIGGEKDFSGIKGLSYKENGKFIKNPERELITDLDELPLIDYSFVDVKKYISVAPPTYVMRPPVLGVISSRGCPGRCVYCTVRAVWGRSWRGKSPKRTVDELELLHKKYGIREFSFLDDSASVNKARWNEICDEIINRKLDIKWSTPNGIAHWTLDSESLLKMKQAGCYRITFGIESGNLETRNFIGKPYPLSQAKDLIQYANRLGMWTICTHILGFPYETREQMEDTIQFANTFGTDFAVFFALFPQVTSDVYEYFKKEGLLNLDNIFNDNNFNEAEYEKMFNILANGGVSTKYLTGDEIKQVQSYAYRSFIIKKALYFIFNPFHLLLKIKSLEDLKYMGKLGTAGAKILLRSLLSKIINTKSFLYD